MNKHVLYETGDTGAPKQIIDRNGEVVLGLCKLCGKAEAELDGGCTDAAERINRARRILAQVRDGYMADMTRDVTWLCYELIATCHE
jgi:hypothetical protein